LSIRKLKGYVVRYQDIESPSKQKIQVMPYQLVFTDNFKIKLPAPSKSSNPKMAGQFWGLNDMAEHSRRPKHSATSVWEPHRFYNLYNIQKESGDLMPMPPLLYEVLQWL